MSEQRVYILEWTYRMHGNGSECGGRGPKADTSEDLLGGVGRIEWVLRRMTDNRYICGVLMGLGRVGGIDEEEQGWNGRTP